jgi:hypothetical protein
MEYARQAGVDAQAGVCDSCCCTFQTSQSSEVVQYHNADSSAHVLPRGFSCEWLWLAVMCAAEGRGWSQAHHSSCVCIRVQQLHIRAWILQSCSCSSGQQHCRRCSGAHPQVAALLISCAAASPFRCLLTCSVLNLCWELCTSLSHTFQNITHL